MITVGIDSGSQNTKVVALRDGQLIGSVSQATLFDVEKAAQDALEHLLKETGLTRSEVAAIAATGAGRGRLRFIDGEVNEVIAAAQGARFMVPDCGFALEMGAEGSRAIRLNPDGSVKTYTANDKCASGGGMFIETVARVLQLKTEELGECAMRHTKEIPMNAQCVVFVESEVISLIHRNESREDIAYAVLSGLSSRLGSMARGLEISGSVAFVGGPAKNIGLVSCLEKALKAPVVVPDRPEFAGAIGAAVHAVKLAENRGA